LDHKSAGIGFHHVIQDCLEFVSPQPGEDDDGFHICPIHAGDHVGGRNGFTIDAGGVVYVIVDVNDVIFCAGNFVRRNVEHGLGIPVLQEKGHALGGVGVFAVLNVLRAGRARSGESEGCKDRS
jgi:hypothetical protein